MTIPSVQSTKKIIIGIGSSAWAKMGDSPVIILVTKLAMPRAVAAKSTGKIYPCETYRMLKEDEIPNLRTRIKSGKINESWCASP